MARLLRRFFLVVAGAFAIVILIAIAFTADYSHAPRYRQETGTLGAIRTIHTAQVQYYSQHAKYASSLTELGPPTSGADSPAAANLIDSTIAAGEKGGYKFTVSGNAGGYVISAVPVAFGVSGSRTFYSDQSMTVRQNFGQEPATANSPEMK